MFFWISDKDIQNTKALIAKGGIDSAATFTIWIVVALVFLGLVLGAISYLARAAFLHGISQERSGASFRFGELVRFGWRRMWRLWGMDIIMGLGNIPLLAVAILTVIAASKGSAVASGFFAATIIIMVVYNIGIMLFKHYAHCFAVLENAKAWTAIKSGWQLFLKNAGVTVVANLIYIGILIGSGLAIFISIFILAIPFVIIGIVLGLTVGPVGVGIISVIALLALFAYIIVLRGLINAFMFTYLTQVYWGLKSGENVSAENDGKSAVNGSAKLR